MKNFIFNLTFFALIATTISCSNQDSSLAEESATDISLEVTSRSLDTPNSEENQFLLIQKWENESDKTFIDLKIDGTFESNLEEGELINGTWTISEDQKVLKLIGGHGQEGKGKNFHVTYNIVEMSFETMQITTQEGNKMTFTANH